MRADLVVCTEAVYIPRQAMPKRLLELLQDKRVVICVGSGGVGKTTTAASLAVATALQGQSALCLTIDPAKRLAQSMGIDPLKAEAQTVKLPDTGGVHIGLIEAMALDPKATFDDLVRRYASHPAAAEAVLGNRLYRYISGSLSGTLEYMAMEKLFAVRNDAKYARIVLDTPPSANAVDFLSAPEKLIALVDAPVMQMLAQALTKDRKSLLPISKGFSLLIAGLSKITGKGFFEQVAEFVVGVGDLFGGFRTRAHSVMQSLRAQDTAFVLVTAPSADCVDEIISLHGRLSAQGMHVAAAILNRMPHAPAANPAPLDVPEERRARLTAALAFATERQRIYFDEARRQVARVQALGVPVYTVAELAQPVDAIDDIMILAQTLANVDTDVGMPAVATA